LGRDMPEVNVRQAMVPEGAEILENSRGTAPGLWIEDAGRAVVLLPGPPRELKPLFREQVLPRLERRVSGVRLYSRELRVTGLGESHVEQRILPIYKRYPEVQNHDSRRARRNANSFALLDRRRGAGKTNPE